MPLNLYLIKRKDDEVGYHEIASVVVAAPTAALARQEARDIDEGVQEPEVWSVDNAAIQKIGTAAARVRQGVIHAHHTGS